MRVVPIIYLACAAFSGAPVQAQTQSSSLQFHPAIRWEEPAALPKSTYEAFASTAAKTPTSDTPEQVDLRNVDALIFGRTSIDMKQNGISILRAEASSGNSNASLRLGAAYEFGIGVDKDTAAAFANYLEAAQNDNSAAQQAIGRAYIEGLGTAPNYAESFKWLKSAYDNGATTASLDLAKSYEHGLGVEVNVGLSEQFWTQAVSFGSSEAYLGYAEFLTAKKGLLANSAAVKELVSKAAELNDIGAISAAYDLAVKAGDEPEQKRWIAKLESLSSTVDPLAAAKLADAYMEEGGAFFDPKAAFALYKSAADQGDAYSEAKYATLVLNDPSFSATVTRTDAIRALKRSAGRGQPQALMTLAGLAEADGDLHNAYAYATSAAELGGQEYSASAQRIRLSVCAESVDPVCEPIPVFYITNRQVKLGEQGVEFGNRLATNGDLSMGHSLVSIPTAQVAPADQRSLWEILRDYIINLGLPSSPSSETTVQDDEVFSTIYDGPVDGFLNEVKKSANKNQREKVIIFIHGFANTFDDSVRRIALISEASKYPGIPIVLSWASAGQSGVNFSPANGYTGPGYTNDLLTVGQSCGAFQQVLEKVIDVFGPDNVTVFAHSMGSLLVDYMLSGCPNYPVAWNRDRKIGNLVLAAPDVDLSQFASHIDAVRSAVDNLTIYVSANDLALRAAQEAVGGRRRLGQGGAERFVTDSVMTIDATTVEVASGLNHSYVFDVSQVKRDLSDLLRGNFDPNLRVCPKSFRDERARLDYWVLQPNCTQ